MRKIAVTGTIGSGKSTVSNLLKEMHYPVFDADQDAAGCLKKTGDAYASVLETFGDSILDESGEIDHASLASIVFADSSSRNKLNGIVHPLILKHLFAFFDAHKDGLVFAEIPLLFQYGWEKYFDQSIVVTCAKKTAIHRLMETRGYTKEQAEARIASQLPAETQIQKADIVFYNDEDKEALYEAVRKWLKEEEARYGAN